jgi:branched-chain amino acid transport system substrate-binding protein
MRVNRAIGALGGLALSFSITFPAGAAEPIVVGSVLDETGGLNIYGKAMVDSTNLAIKHINEQGGVLGRQLKLVSYDSQSDNAKYTLYANQLALQDKAVVIMGGITSASREAMRPIMDRNKTLYFYNEQYEGGVCDKNVFATGIVPSQQVAPTVAWAIKNIGKKFYVLAADYNYGHISADWVNEYVKQGGGSVIGTDFIPLDVAEFGSIINKLQDAKPDVVFSLLVGGNHIAFYRQFAALDLGSKMKIVTATFGLGNEQVVVAANEAKDIVAVYPYFQEVDNPVNREFVSMWHKEYGADYPYITDSAVTVWNGWHLWAKAVQMAGSTDRARVIKALESRLSFDGPSGTVTIDGRSHHLIQNTHFGRTNDKHGFTIISSQKAVPPAYEQKVCDLIKNPNQHTQFTPGGKQ